MARRALIAIALLLAAAAPAAADPDRWPRWQRGYAIAAGASEIGDVTFAQIGLQLRLSVRARGRLRLAATGEMLDTNRDTADGLLEGRTVRGLLGVEWLLRGPRRADADFSPRVYATAGTGGELITWDRGLAARPVSYVGVELVNGFLIPDGRFLRGLHSVSFRVGLRLDVAPRVPLRELLPRCGGCASSVDGAPPDLGVMFTMGLDFGR